MAKLSKTQRGAVELFREFREASPSRAKRVDFNVPDAVMVMGPCEAILYRTTHGRKAALYKHTFAAGSRPLLCAGPGENELYLIGGRYRVTERGIVDLDADGEEIDDGGGR